MVEQTHSLARPRRRLRRSNPGLVAVLVELAVVASSRLERLEVAARSPMSLQSDGKPSAAPVVDHRTRMAD